MFTFKPFLFALQLQEPDACTQVQCAWARDCRLPAFHPPCTRHRQAESNIMLNPVRMRSVVFTTEVCHSKCVCMCMQVHAHACPTKQTHSDVPDTFCKSCTQKIQCRPWRAVWVVATMLLALGICSVSMHSPKYSCIPAGVHILSQLLSQLRKSFVRDLHRCSCGCCAGFMMRNP